MKKALFIAALALLLPACGEMTPEDEITPEKENQAEFEERLEMHPMFHAAGRSPAALEKLLSEGGDPDFRDDQGRTPLMQLTEPYLSGIVDKSSSVTIVITEDISRDDFEKITLLLKYGADPMITDMHSNSPFDLAIECGRIDLLELYLHHGADPKVVDSWGETPLHKAAKAGHGEVVQMLLDAGCGINARDNGGRTALDVARNDEIKDLLRSCGAVTGKELQGEE